MASHPLLTGVRPVVGPEPRRVRAPAAGRRAGAIVVLAVALAIGGCTGKVEAPHRPAGPASFVQTEPLRPELPATASGTLALSALPEQAQQVYRLIRQGGPFRYDKDGSVFGNFEGHLPRQPRGYYREYTVPRPHGGDRGARRIICGGPPVTPDVCYYTADHYNSFKTIAP